MEIRKVIVAGAGILCLALFAGETARSETRATVGGDINVTCPGGTLSVNDNVPKCGGSGDGESERSPADLTPEEREAVREIVREAIEDLEDDLGVRLGT